MAFINTHPNLWRYLVSQNINPSSEVMDDYVVIMGRRGDLLQEELLSEYVTKALKDNQIQRRLEKKSLYTKPFSKRFKKSKLPDWF